jgi:hypothetical protein
MIRVITGLVCGSDPVGSMTYATIGHGEGHGCL